MAKGSNGSGRPCEYSQLWLVRHLQHDGAQQDEPCRHLGEHGIDQLISAIHL